MCVRLALRRGPNGTLADAREEIVLSACHLVKIVQTPAITQTLLAVVLAV